MFLYIFDHANSDWIEAGELYPHDIALLIDNEAREVYFYAGTKSKLEMRDIAMKRGKEIMEKFSSYRMSVLEDVIPLKIQAEIDLLLGDNLEAARFKEKRTIFMLVQIISGLLFIVVHFIVVINSFRMLAWNREGSLFMVSSSEFDANFQISIIIGWIVIGIGIFFFLNTLATKKIFLIVCGVVANGIFLGFFLYLRKTIYIFDFPISDPFEIGRLQLFLHILWICLGWIATSASILIPIYFIFQQTEIKPKRKLELDEMRNATKPTILRDKESPDMKEIKE